MKRLILTLVVLMITAPAMAEMVDGYRRSNGTYVSPYIRTERNNSIYDNYSAPRYQTSPTAYEGLNSWGSL